MIDNTRVANTIEIKAKLTAMKKNTTINIAKQRKHDEDRIEFVINTLCLWYSQSYFKYSFNVHWISDNPGNLNKLQNLLILV